MKLHQPSEEEKRYCEVEDFSRDPKDEFDINEKNELTLRLYSTQTDDDIEIHNLDDMPCMILDYKDGIKSVDCK
jgi:hypothetical protein